MKPKTCNKFPHHECINAYHTCPLRDKVCELIEKEREEKR